MCEIVHTTKVEEEVETPEAVEARRPLRIDQRKAGRQVKLREGNPEETQQKTNWKPTWSPRFWTKGVRVSGSLGANVWRSRLVLDLSGPRRLDPRYASFTAYVSASFYR